MTSKEQASIAEQVDQMMQRIALSVFLVAVAYAISTARFLVDESTKDVLDNISRVLGVVILVLLLPKFLKFVALRRSNRTACKEPEGFVIEMFNQATGKAFQFTFIFLIALEFASDTLLANMPGEFFVKLTITFTLAFFSLTFFFLNRAQDGTDDGFDVENRDDEGKDGGHS